MGQRTAIIVKNNDTRYDRKPTVSVFYNSWGIGRACIANVMGVALGTFNIIHHAESMHPANTYDVTADIDPVMLDKVGFDNPRAVGEVLKECDNNNGGCYVQIDIDKDGDRIVKYAFMLGMEEGGKYDKFCSFKKYADKVGCDKDFLPVFSSVMCYMGAVDVGASISKAQ